MPKTCRIDFSYKIFALKAGNWGKCYSLKKENTFHEQPFSWIKSVTR